MKRAGILTHASFLTANASATSSHPVKRGVRIYGGLLCGSLGSPPEMPPPPASPPQNVSTREVFEAHDRQECARACHQLFDPLGFAFENYDAVGHHRFVDGGKPV